MSDIQSAARKANAKAQAAERHQKETADAAEVAEKRSRQAKTKLKQAKKASKKTGKAARKARRAADAARKLFAKASARAVKATARAAKARKKAGKKPAPKRQAAHQATVTLRPRRTPPRVRPKKPSTPQVARAEPLHTETFELGEADLT